MRVVLEHIATGLFLRGLNEWTRKSAEALPFLTAAQAWRFAEDNSITDVRMVMRFEMPDHNVLLPLTTSKVRAAARSRPGG